MLGGPLGHKFASTVVLVSGMIRRPGEDGAARGYGPCGTAPYVPSAGTPTCQARHDPLAKGMAGGGRRGGHDWLREAVRSWHARSILFSR